MTTVPGAIAVTTPSDEIVAINASDVVHWIAKGLSEYVLLSLNVPAAENVMGPPALGPIRFTSDTAILCSVAFVTVTFADVPPALTVVTPAFNAVARPRLLTLATVSYASVQTPMIDLNCCCAPTGIATDAGEIDVKTCEATVPSSVGAEWPSQAMAQIARSQTNSARTSPRIHPERCSVRSFVL